MLDLRWQMSDLGRYFGCQMSDVGYLIQKNILDGRFRGTIKYLFRYKTKKDCNNFAIQKKLSDI